MIETEKLPSQEKKRHNVLHEIRTKKEEEINRILERDALNELFEQLEPWQNIGVFNIKSLI